MKGSHYLSPSWSWTHYVDSEDDELLILLPQTPEALQAWATQPSKIYFPYVSVSQPIHTDSCGQLLVFPVIQVLCHDICFVLVEIMFLIKSHLVRLRVVCKTCLYCSILKKNNTIVWLDQRYIGTTVNFFVYYKPFINKCMRKFN